MKKFFLLFGPALLLALALFGVRQAIGQSSPGFVYGQVPTAAQWNSYFAAKQDVLGFPPVNKNGDTMLGQLVIVSSSINGAGLNLIPGTAPTSPNDGDVWITNMGMFAQAGGVTYGPFGNANQTHPLTVNLNTGTLLPAQTGTLFQGQAADSTVARSELDSFGAIASFSGVVSGGTRASPSAVTSGTQLTGINAFVFDGSTYDGPAVSFRTYAGENISPGHNGTKACVATTQVATTTLADSLCQWPSGGITIGSPTGGDQGAGTINAATGFLVNGATIGLSSIAANSVLANFTSGSAVPIGNSVNGGSSCGDATHAVKFTAGTGFGCQAITATATAGGSNTQIQYNNSGAIGGVAGATTNGTIVTFASGDLNLSGSGSGTVVLNAPATGGGTLTLPAGTDSVLGAASTNTLTNKTFDSAGTGNVFKINGTSITAILGNAATVATATGSFTTGDCLQVDSNSNIVDSGNPCSSGGGAPGGATGSLQYNNAGVFGSLTNSKVNSSSLELGATTTPTNTLTLASASSGVKWFNTAAQVTNTQDGVISFVAGAFTIQTENAGTGTAVDLNITSVRAVTLTSAAAQTISFKVGSTIIEQIASTKVTFYKDLFTSGNPPILSGCGSGPTVTAGSTDTAGEVNEGTTAVGCTVTWSTAKATAPFCVISYESTVAAMAYTTFTANMIVTHTSASSKSFTYYCVQH